MHFVAPKMVSTSVVCNGSPRYLPCDKTVAPGNSAIVTFLGPGEFRPELKGCFSWDFLKVTAAESPIVVFWL